MRNIDDGLKWYQRKRYLYCIILFFGYIHVFFLGVNIFVFFSMTDKASEDINSGLGVSQMYFKWGETEALELLLLFFVGYMLTQLPGGILAAQFGTKYVMAAGVGVPGLITALSPWITQLPIEIFMISRFGIGLFLGVTVPCNLAFWSRWAPPKERSSLVSLAYSGIHIGTATVLGIGPYINDSIGWPWTFMFTGMSAMIWSIIWLYVVHTDPDSDPLINPKELEYIKSQVGPISLIKINKHPWKSILTSLPVWSNAITLTVMNLVLYTYLMQIPVYLIDVYDYPVSETGFPSYNIASALAICFIYQTVVILCGAQIADCVITRETYRVVTVRKFLVLFSCIGQSLACTLISLIFDNLVADISLAIMMSFNALSWPGFSVNCLEMAPPHASVLIGFANTFGTLGGIISPFMKGFLIPDKTFEQWSIVFIIIGGLLTINGIFYGIFASADLQPWVTKSEN